MSRPSRKQPRALNLHDLARLAKLDGPDEDALRRMAQPAGDRWRALMDQDSAIARLGTRWRADPPSRKSLEGEAETDAFVLGTLIWGYPHGLRGMDRNGRFVRSGCTLSELLATWSAELDLIRKKRCVNAAAVVAAAAKMKHCGVSTLSKFLALSRVTVDGWPAVIIDLHVRRAARVGFPWAGHPPQWPRLSDNRSLTIHHYISALRDLGAGLQRAAPALRRDSEQFRLAMQYVEMRMFLSGEPRWAAQARSHAP